MYYWLLIQFKIVMSIYSCATTNGIYGIDYGNYFSIGDHSMYISFQNSLSDISKPTG